MKLYKFLLPLLLVFSLRTSFCSGLIDEDVAAATKLVFSAIDQKKDISYLLELGADVNDTKVKGCTPLAYAIRKGETLAIDALLPKTDLSFVWSEGTYLHEVLRSKKLDLIQKFVSAYRDQQKFKDIISISDHLNNTPFHLLAEFISEDVTHEIQVNLLREILEEFKDFGGDIQRQNTNGATVISILQNAQKMITRHRRLTLGWTPMHILIKGNDLTLEGENLDQVWEAYKQDSLWINVPNLKGTTPFIMVAFKLKKFKKLKNDVKKQAWVKLLMSMKDNGGLADLKNSAGASVNTILSSKKVTFAS